MPGRFAALIGSLVCSASCFQPSPPQGAACAADERCPSPLVCQVGVCVRAGTMLDGPTDALAADADASRDGRVLDAVTASMLVPSNGVDPTLVNEVTDAITLGSASTLDTDTGAITGELVRAAGSGVIAGVGFASFMAPTGTNLGVFVFDALSLGSSGSMRITGSRPAVFLIKTDASIAGSIDANGGCLTGTGVSCQGPGGGSGGSKAIAATGCAPGAVGPGTTSSDGGGGGGGGGGSGGTGGSGGAAGSLGGSGGGSCVALSLEPLVGGAGGGGGSPGSGTATFGGGGGGALQLTAFGSITITGAIFANGAGGEGGPVGSSGSTNGGAGAGGGAGGGILLEAPMVSVLAGATLAANGGGGGGAADQSSVGHNGATSGLTANVATGGAALGGNGAGGNGATGAAPPGPGTAGTSGTNGGGGGGAIGVIYVRTAGSAALGGTFSPTPGAGIIHTQ